MSPITSHAWQAVQGHCREFAPSHLRELFAADPSRFSGFSIQVEDLLVDFSKQRIDEKAIQLLTALAEAGNCSAPATTCAQPPPSSAYNQKQQEHT